MPETGPFKIDAIPPAISPISGFTPDGQQGWFDNSPAVDTVSAADDISGIASIDCTDDLNGLTMTGSGESRALTVNGSGIQHLRCTATNVAGNTSAPTTLTVKIDATPPSCTAAATPQSLWPPNHQFAGVTVSLKASAGVSGLQSITGMQASSNEDNTDIAANVQGLGIRQTHPPAAPDSTGPASYMSTATGQVRSERFGNSSGRIYTLMYTVANMAGSTAPCAATITVPRDQGG